MEYFTQIIILLFLFINVIESKKKFNLTDVIQTNKGPVQGKVSYTVQEKKKYWSFLGIPYAKSTSGQLRFLPPEEMEEWDEVISVTRKPKPCSQLNPDREEFNGGEDCLELSVLTPKTSVNDTHLRAVMVYIYGGGFAFGNTTVWRHDFLLEEDVVIVTMNYRVGALGLLCLNHPNATGNAAVKDQQLALKWVQTNIKKFGGDPKKVTIFGQSAGAVFVQLHVLSDNSKGLFRGAISMSGTPLSRWAFSTNKEAVDRALKLGEIIGVKSGNKDEILKKLYTMSTKDIINATKEIPTIDPTQIVFKPTVEHTNASHACLTEDFDVKYRKGDFSHVPIMLGFVDSEFLHYNIEYIRSSIKFLLKTMDPTVLPTLSATKFLKQFYDSNIKNIKPLPMKMQQYMMQILSDLVFIAGIDKTQRYLSAFNSAPVYYYRNSFQYAQSLHKISGIIYNGTAHADDTAHIFYIKNSHQSLDPKSEISIHRKKMVKLWTNFAKYLDPTPGHHVDQLLKVKWVPSNQNGATLDINNQNFSIVHRPVSNLVELLVTFT